MCLILLSQRQYDEYPLLLAANRDEFYRRPSQTAHFWDDAPQVLGGRDLEQGGTWLGISRQGRIAAVTNIRAPASDLPFAKSRGKLTRDFLTGEETPGEYYEKIRPDLAQYNGFNLLFGSTAGLYFLSSEDRDLVCLEGGLYGLSNAGLDTPWPKVREAKRALRPLLQPAPDIPAIVAMLGDRQRAPDRELPDTGVGLEWERILSSRFINTPDYGTRASTVLLVDRTGKVWFHEQNFMRGGQPGELREYRFNITAR